MKILAINGSPKGNRSNTWKLTKRTPQARMYLQSVYLQRFYRKLHPLFQIFQSLNKRRVRFYFRFFVVAKEIHKNIGGLKGIPWAEGFAVLKAIFLIKLWRLKIGRAFHRPEFPVKIFPVII